MKNFSLKKLKLKTASICALLLLAFTPSAFSCSVCFYGDPSSKQTTALRYSVLFLLIVLLTLMVLFTKFFFSFRKRAKLLNEGTKA